MARQRDEGLEDTYAAVQRFVHEGLRTDGSMFTPGAHIWTAANAADLSRRFIDTPDEGEGTFMDKLEKQLAGAPDPVLQLAAEMLYVYFLGDSTPGGDAKRAPVQRTLSWISGPPVGLPPELSRGLDRGFGAGGLWAATGRFVHYGYLIRFIVHWKSLDVASRDAAFADPWRFKRETLAVPSTQNTTYMQAAIRYFAHIDAFEPIYSEQHRHMIVRALGHLAPDVTDQDQRLLAIRRGLTERYGPIDFYDSNAVLALWNPTYAPWRVFVYWCGRALEHPNFQGWEIDYKLTIADRLRQAKDAVVAGDPAWVDLLREALRRENSLINYRSADDVVQWTVSEPDSARAALRSLWTDDRDVLDRVATFFERLPRSVVSGPGGRALLVSLLLMAEDPHRYPPFKPTEYQWAWAMTRFQPEQQTDSGMYARALDFLDQIIEKGREQGVHVPDRLHAQGAMWTVLRLEEAHKPADWTDDEWQGLLALRKLATQPSEDELGEPPLPQPTPSEVDHIEELADRLLIDASWLRETVDLLDDKRQVIFYGPPGTGKTFVAQKLAEALAGGKDGVSLVQFHPSYSYEDFVEGYRPKVLVNGQPGFELRPGPLKRLAERARADQDRTFVLIIDEINRGNIAKVLGELYFLLEYRNEDAFLLYSAERFTLPENLRIIGTMNTADRSIALMDAALRRRFGFVGFFPDEYPHQGLLRRWLERSGSSVLWVADMLEELNRQLGDRNSAIGPSYFLREGLTAEKVERIWRHEIQPQLEELYFDQPERIADLSLVRLRAQVTRSQTAATAGPDAPSSHTETEPRADAAPQPD